MSNEFKKAKDFFKNDKIRNKLICQVIISGDEKSGNAKYCNKELANNKNTSGMNGHLLACHKEVKFTTRNENRSNASSLKNLLLNKSPYDPQSERYISLIDCV